jgi:hypothetical protein
MSRLNSQPTSASKVIIETKTDLFSIIDFSAERHFGTQAKGKGEKTYFGLTKICGQEN